jgi:succinate-semialdehyde dehydrogenase/glutarate-semialdehyde dehydrogenase/succinyl-CoA reductase
VANEFTEKFVQKTERLKVGDPLSDDTDIGPVVNAKSLENMEGVVNRTVKEGAELLTGGERIADDAAQELSRALEDIAYKISKQAIDFAAHAGRDTIKAEDIR